MNRILSIDSDNRMATVEPGVTNAELQAAAAEQGFFWPPDPTSAAVCTIGGNLAYNSAGPRAVKYGTPRENTLALRAVTGSGESIRTGSMTTKGVVGYDLTRLLIGSEGTLGVVTEATLKLEPLPEIPTIMDLATRSFARDQISITLLYFSPWVIRPSVYCRPISATCFSAFFKMVPLLSGYLVSSKKASILSGEGF